MEDFEAKWEEMMAKLGYHKIAPEMAAEVTEFAEILHNFRGAMTVENIKASLVSFLLANHYRRIDLEKLTVLTNGEIKKVIPGYIDYGAEVDGEFDWSKPKFSDGSVTPVMRAIAQAQLDHDRKTIEEVQSWQT